MCIIRHSASATRRAQLGERTVAHREHYIRARVTRRDYTCITSRAARIWANGVECRGDGYLITVSVTITLRRGKMQHRETTTTTTTTTTVTMKTGLEIVG